MVYSARSGRRGPRSSALALLVAALTGCGSVATDGSGPGRGALAIAPEYPPGFEAGTLNLVIDRIRVQVVRPPSEWLVDTSATFPADAQSVTMRVSMPLKARQERLGVVLELWAGPLLVFAGARNIDVSEGSPTGPAPRIPLTYRGPGAEARAIRITPRDTVMTPGSALPFGVVADNGEGVPVGDVYVAWSIAEGAATVTPAGVLTAPAGRGSAVLRAAAATGARDSTRIWFSPPAVSVVPVTGGGQSGQVGTALPAPLVARVLAADGLGVPNLPVQFLSVATGAVFTSPVVRTDPDGYARTDAALGTRAGPQGFTAFVAGVGAAHFTVTALVGPASQIVIARGNGQEGPADSQLPVPLEVSIRDLHGNPVAGARVRWEVMQGGGLLGLSETTSDVSGAALASYTLGPVAGTNTVRATLTSTGTSVVFVLQGR